MQPDFDLDELREKLRGRHNEAIAALAGAGDDKPGAHRRLLRGSVGRELGKLANAVQKNGPGALVDAVNKHTDVIRDVGSKIPEAASKIANSLDYNTDTIASALDRIGRPPAGTDNEAGDQVHSTLVKAIRSGGSFDEALPVGALLHAAGYPDLRTVANASRDQFRADMKKSAEDSKSSVSVRDVDIVREVARKVSPPRATRKDETQ